MAKSLSATEGAILLVDATQGVQAQTIANYRIAKQHHLPLIPVLNKVDLASADIDAALAELHDLDSAFTPDQVLLISAKTGQGVPAVLEAIRTRLPAPTGDATAPLKALVFDSLYDPYQGVIAYVRLIDGQLKSPQALRLMAADCHFTSL